MYFQGDPRLLTEASANPAIAQLTVQTSPSLLIDVAERCK